MNGMGRRFAFTCPLRRAGAAMSCRQRGSTSKSRGRTLHGLSYSLVLALVGVIVGANSARATTYRVPSEYITILAGIVQCSPGDTVLVAPGTYTGTGNRNLNSNGTNIVLRSESGPESTIIDCQLATWALLLGAGMTGETVVDGFTFENATTAISITAGAPTLRNCSFGNNVKALDCTGSSSPIVDSCAFVGNGDYLVASSGAIQCSSISLFSCTFEDNQTGAFGSGGALAIGSGTIDSCS